MLAGSFAMSVNNALLKWLSTGYPAGEILFLRGIFLFLPVLFVIARSGDFASLRIVSYRNHSLRAFWTICSAFLFVAALRALPLADVVALTFAGPLFVTLLSWPMLGEQVGWRRWAAVVVGFVGVLIITRPTGDVAWLLMLLPLGAALAAAIRDLMTRSMTAVESSNSIMVTTTAAVALAGLATAPIGFLRDDFAWIAPTWADFGLIAASGFAAGIGHYCMIESLRHGEAALVSPFKYGAIIWATIMGYLFWDHLPDLWVIIGAGIVIGSGLYILHRELLRKRAAQSQRPPAQQSTG